MNNHTDLLNFIASKIGAKSYLEIGTNNGKNFNSIAVAHKVGVDPDLTAVATVHKTSDEFFKDNQETFDLVFIDGLHHADQVKRDIENGFHSLPTGGVLVIHDCNPSDEKHTHVPRDSKVWNGDVYKTVSGLTGGFTMDMDYGCYILRKEEDVLVFAYAEGIDNPWEYFNKYRKELLNLVSVEEGLKIIDSWI